MSRRKKVLEGVVVKLSEVNRYRRWNKIYILRCTCFRDWKEDSKEPGTRVSFPEPASRLDDTVCPVCDKWPWYVGKMLPRGGILIPRNRPKTPGVDKCK